MPRGHVARQCRAAHARLHPGTWFHVLVRLSVSCRPDGPRRRRTRWRAIGLRPPGRRLCQCAGAERRPGRLRGALRARQELPILELLVSVGVRRAGHVLAQARGGAARQGELLRVGRARRRRDRTGARRDPNIRSTASAATTARSRPQSTRAARHARPPAKPIAVAVPGPICGPAMAPRQRNAFSRIRSSRRAAVPVACPAWCAKALDATAPW